MIGGTDIVIPALGGPEALDACVRIVQRHWPQARFEDAVTGDKYRSYGELPMGRVRQLLVYPNVEAEAAWDADDPDSPPNSMLYLILSPTDITAVLDDPAAADMQAILASIRTVLRMDILNTLAEAA
jgi:hypothetical protein